MFLAQPSRHYKNAWEVIIPSTTIAQPIYPDLQLIKSMVSKTEQWSQTSRQEDSTLVFVYRWWSSQSCLCKAKFLQGYWFSKQAHLMEKGMSQLLHDFHHVLTANLRWFRLHTRLIQYQTHHTNMCKPGVGSNWRDEYWFALAKISSANVFP